MDLGITGRVALVTASSSGLGRASAEALAAEGAKVVICARGEDRLREVERSLQAAGAAVHAIVADVTDPAVPEALVAETMARFGSIDVLVANAGGPPAARALELSDDAVRAAVEANLLSSIRLIRSSLPHMQAKGWGRICCITSHSVVQPIPGLALSNLARTGLRAWAKTAAADLAEAQSGITLNLVCPGLHSTPRMLELGATPGPNMGDPADFGKVVAFLCSDPARFVNGASVVVDGGSSLAL